jgi:hypothetical protein
MRLWLGFIFTMIGLTPISVQSRENAFPWLDDLDQARQLASHQNKPLLVVFRCEP